uniref:Large ribosomal subunit protein uL18c n=1 Tax=Synura uvella TaxID=52557 RepID=A0A3G2QZ75_9STRA|nr:ribosomal protein L18 [Synura uvella]AYO28417.1 ribosomal protein L18 [Synura uvella]
MKKKIKKIFLQKKKRYLKKIVGTTEKPRLSVFRSHKHIYAQLIDDQKAHTLAFSSTLDKNISNNVSSTATKEASNLVGINIAQKAKEKNISYVVFDRGNRPYHGRIQSVAEGARTEGLKF